MNKSYEFIAYPYGAEFSGVTKTSLKMAIEDQDITLDEMLEQFEYFLKGAGFVIDVDQRLELVGPDEEEEEEEDFSAYHFDNSFDMEELDRRIDESFKGWEDVFNRLVHPAGRSQGS